MTAQELIDALEKLTPEQKQLRAMAFDSEKGWEDILIVHETDDCGDRIIGLCVLFTE